MPSTHFAAGHPPSYPTAWGTVPPGFQRPQNPGLAAFRFGKSPIALPDDSECPETQS